MELCGIRGNRDIDYPGFIESEGAPYVGIGYHVWL